MEGDMSTTIQDDPMSDAMAIGAHQGIPFEQYARIPAINWHLLKPFSISPLQGRHEMTNPEDATEHMNFGGAFHTAILEPHLFESIYAIMPKFPGHPNSNAYKALKSEWEEANRESVKLTTDEVRRLKGMQKAVMAHPTVNALLSGKGRNELTIIWKDDETGLTCKGRVDRLTRVDAKILNPNAGGSAICVVDFKKTSLFHKFENEIAKYGYHAQLSSYRDAIAQTEKVNPETITPIIVAVEDDEPYDVVPWLMVDACEHGRRLYRRLLRTYVSCNRNDRWPGMCPYGTVPAILPKWSEEGKEPT